MGKSVFHFVFLPSSLLVEWLGRKKDDDHVIIFKRKNSLFNIFPYIFHSLLNFSSQTVNPSQRTHSLIYMIIKLKLHNQISTLPHIIYTLFCTVTVKQSLIIHLLSIGLYVRSFVRTFVCW